MHLDAVLVLVSLHVHPLELLGCVQLGDDASIDFEIIKRSFVLLADRQGALPQADVMRRPEDENPLHRRGADLTIGPGGSFTRIGVAGVRLKDFK